MNRQQAERIAIEAMEAQIKSIALDANLHDRGIASYGYTEKCSKRRKQLIAAIEAIGLPVQVGMF